MVETDGADPPVGRMSPAASVWWALLPLLTFGLGTMFVLGWAANRLRSRWLAFCAVAALVVTAVALPLNNSPQGSTRSTIAGVLIIVGLMGGGLTATFAIRRRLIRPDFPDRATSGPEVGWASSPAWVPGGDSTDPAVAEALEHRRRRLEARHLLERDPGLARELRVGRPDLPRQYDDGGLVDVNHVPVAVLTILPGFTPELAERVARVRDEHGGFSYVEEMGIYAELPDGFAEELAERLVFVK